MILSRMILSFILFGARRVTHRKGRRAVWITGMNFPFVFIRVHSWFFLNLAAFTRRA
jgi:hypothetical protein